MAPLIAPLAPRVERSTSGVATEGSTRPSSASSFGLKPWQDDLKPRRDGDLSFCTGRGDSKSMVMTASRTGKRDARAAVGAAARHSMNKNAGRVGQAAPSYLPRAR